ncbi:MAG: metalloregulator ArsR/SmtB family transcription factor [archaeon]|jgi:DNA-binding transcriptional ArsR family regulator|nr:metalloregulator ArsR/SmtB family transcription factor [archaeon]
MNTDSVPYHLCLETLGNELRVKVLESLGEKPKTVGELSKELNAEQSRLSHSLKALKQCNFVASKAKGKKRFYQLTRSFVKEMPKSKNIFEALEKHFEKFGCKCWRQKA